MWGSSWSPWALMQERCCSSGKADHYSEHWPWGVRYMTEAGVARHGRTQEFLKETEGAPKEDRALKKRSHIGASMLVKTGSFFELVTSLAVHVEPQTREGGYHLRPAWFVACLIPKIPSTV